jgi:hypothetical protein
MGNGLCRVPVGYVLDCNKDAMEAGQFYKVKAVMVLDLSDFSLEEVSANRDIKLMSCKLIDVRYTEIKLYNSKYYITFSGRADECYSIDDNSIVLYNTRGCKIASLGSSLFSFPVLNNILVTVDLNAENISLSYDGESTNYISSNLFFRYRYNSDLAPLRYLYCLMDNEISGIYSLSGVCVITQDADEYIILQDDCKHIIFDDSIYNIKSLVVNDGAVTVDYSNMTVANELISFNLSSLYISKNIKKSVLVPLLHLYFCSLKFKGYNLARNKLEEYMDRQDYELYWEELHSDSMRSVTKDLLSDLSITVY